MGANQTSDTGARVDLVRTVKYVIMIEIEWSLCYTAKEASESYS